MEKTAQGTYGAVGGCPEKVEADTEEDHIEDTRNEDPFPDLMFRDEMMGLDIRLEGYDDFFEQFSFCYFYCETQTYVFMANRQKAAALEPLPASFYDRPGVVTVARELLGKVLVTEFGGRRTSGRIVEVEAYNGVVDRASHAWSGRRT